MRETVGALLFKGTGALLAFAFSVQLARSFGADIAGVFYTAMPVILIAGYIARAGLDQLLMRETAVALSIGVSIAGLVNGARKLTLMGFFACAAAVLVLAPILARTYRQPELEQVLIVLIPAIGAQSVINLAGQIVRGAGQIWRSSFVLFTSVNLLSCAALLLAIRGLAKYLQVSPTEIAPASYCVASVATAGLALRWLAGIDTRQSSHEDAKVSHNSPADLFRAGLPLTIYGLAAMAITSTDTLVLAAFSNSHQVAVYNSAVKVAQCVGFIMLAVVTAVGPRLSALYRANRIDALQRAIDRAAAFATVTALPVVIALWVGGGSVMRIFGPEFIDGRFPLGIVALGYMIAAIYGPAGQVLIASGQYERLRNLTVIVALANVPLNVLLAHFWGALGSAVATAVSVAGLGYTTALLGSRALGLRLGGGLRILLNPSDWKLLAGK